ncbi:Methyltransferase domain-containing protein [Lentzea waywayandensis]|uniref:Methyltransferase domain-containing protein n=1 Tax=Lentzea waywayandensis TaxID=84724 RepID=A0A1I6EZB8_9PSEU|nr:class I SAM-dependent methyltransferase [Lentzea waywayandensis]SFR23019.1 Methyltransferase domain-containing protein [Lentzea waywayandensis]
MTNGNAATGLRDLNAGIPDAAQLKGAVSAVYDDVASWSRTGDFWNWGMHCPELLNELNSLRPNFNAGVSDGFSEQLYFQTLRGLPYTKDDFRTLKVLEVGCGMGEGLNFLTRLIDPAKAIGLDISGAAIRRANAILARGDRLTYVEGDAESLPFEDGEFDLVINVESSHNYPDVEKFFREVARVLRPGGHFSIIDVFDPRSNQRFRGSLQQNVTEFDWIAERDVTENVKSAIRQRMAPGSFFRKEYARKQMPLRARIIGGLGGAHYAGADFIGHKDTLSKVLELARIRTKFVGEYESYRHHLARRG